MNRVNQAGEEIPSSPTNAESSAPLRTRAPAGCFHPVQEQEASALLALALTTSEAKTALGHHGFSPVGVLRAFCVFVFCASMHQCGVELGCWFQLRHAGRFRIVQSPPWLSHRIRCIPCGNSSAWHGFARGSVTIPRNNSLRNLNPKRLGRGDFPQPTRARATQFEENWTRDCSAWRILRMGCFMLWSMKAS